MDSKPTITILDVGHGSAAVLQGDNRVVLFDAGSGRRLLSYLKQKGIKEVEAMLLSHADLDHMGGAISILLDEDLKVKHVFLNADPTKNTVAFKQLQLAIRTAEDEKKTRTETQLTTSLNGRLDNDQIKIEILFPTPYHAVSGVGGSSIDGQKQTSNSLSAAIRILYKDSPKILLGGDVEFSCIDEWKERKINPAADVLVFPHHGGLPGDAGKNEAGIFAFELAHLVNPKVVIFSIHETKHNLPRAEVVEALKGAINSVKFICTQVPPWVKDIVVREKSSHWDIHRVETANVPGCRQGNICIDLDNTENISFEKFPI
jgi:competence protein ComEC